jgi:hypothetical protein
MKYFILRLCVAFNIVYLKKFVSKKFKTFKYKFYMFEYKELHVAQSTLVHSRFHTAKLAWFVLILKSHHQCAWSKH